MRATQDDGTGTVSTIAGVAMVLALLLLAAQVLVHLYTTSAVSAAAYDAARLASGSERVAPAVAAAHGRALLGRFSDHVSAFDVTVTGATVHVHVTATSPALLPAVFTRMTGIGAISEQAVVKVERVVCEAC